MITFQVQTHMFFDRIQRASDRARYGYLRRSAAKVRTVARRSIKRRGRSRKAPKKYKADGKTWTLAFRRWMKELKARPASSPGTPPHTHDGTLREAIMYGFDSGNETAIVGPLKDRVDYIAELHEHGGVHPKSGKVYPARPFMKPALELVSPELPRNFARAFRRAA